MACDLCVYARVHLIKIVLENSAHVGNEHVVQLRILDLAQNSTLLRHQPVHLGLQRLIS